MDLRRSCAWAIDAPAIESNENVAANRRAVTVCMREMTCRREESGPG
jgi:hypothetical protein